MPKLYDQYGKEVQSKTRSPVRTAIKEKSWTIGTKVMAWLIPVFIALVTLVVGTSNWRKEHAPNIGFIGMSVEGVPGKTAVRLQTNYRNVGRSDALNLTSNRRVVPRNESRFPPSDLHGFRSKGRVAPGERFHSEPCDLSLEMSVALGNSQFDDDPLTYRDIFEWDDDNGKHYKYDHCLIWDRHVMDFVQCP
jgi:hypothetical protein